MLVRCLWLGLVAMTVGCGTARFNVPADEVQRLAQLPPGERGRQVRVIPEGAARAVPPSADEPVYGPSEGYGPNLVAQVALDLPVHPGHVRGSRPYVRPSVVPTPVLPSRSLPGTSSAGVIRGAPVPRPPTVGVGTFRGTPVPASAGRGVAPGSFRGTPRPTVPKVSHSGGGHSSGGGGSADGATAVVAVIMAVLVIVVVLDAIAEASAKAEQRVQFAQAYDGWVRVGPGHVLHLHYANQVTRDIALGRLTPQDAEGVRHAYLEDDVDEDVIPLDLPPDWSPEPADPLTSPELPPPPPPPPAKPAPSPPTQAAPPTAPSPPRSGPPPPSAPPQQHPALVS